MADVDPKRTLTARCDLDVQSPTKAAVRMGDWKLVMNAGAPGADDEEAPANRPRARRNAASREEPSSNFMIYRMIGASQKTYRRPKGTRQDHAC